ncbi:Hypothetical predicted protein, partial [Scomber scombrus]
MDAAEEIDRTSHVSSRSSERTSASTASAAAKARAKAEAARVRVSFAEEEAKLKLELAEREATLKLEQVEREARQKAEDARVFLEKAKLDAKLGTLSLQREAAAASIQAEVLEAAEEQVKAPRGKGSQMSLKREIEDRTSAYVKEQNVLHTTSHPDDPAPSPSQPDDSLVT